MMTGRIFATLLACLFVATSVFRAADAQDSTVPVPNLRNIELEKFTPDSINRGETATAEVSFVFERDPNSPRTASDQISEIVRWASVEDLNRKVELSSNVRIITIREGSDQAVVLAQVSISGGDVPIYEALFGTQLVVSIQTLNKSSNSAQLRVSGLSGLDWLVFGGVLAAAAFLIFAAYWVTVRYVRVIRATAETRQRAIELKELRSIRENWRIDAMSASVRPPPVKPVPDIPDRIVDEMVNGTALLGIGSELAESAGAPTPLELIASISSRSDRYFSEAVKLTLAESLKSSSLSANQLSDLFEVMLEVFPRDELVSQIRSTSEEFTANDTAYRALAGLPWAGVFSFTWSKIGESSFIDAFAKSSGDTSNREYALVPEQGAELREALSAKHPFLLKVLGDVRNPNSAMLTLPEFRNSLQFAPEYARQVALLLDTRCFLFVGIPLSTLKEYLQSFLPAPQVSSPRHFAVVPYSADNELYSVTIARYGVTVLEYSDTDGASSLEQFIAKLAAKVAERGTHSAVPASLKTMNHELASQRIRRVELENIGPFNQLTVDFAQAEAFGGDLFPWTVIMGQNGAGKSAILRAIGIALTANEEQVQRGAASLLKQGAKSGRIRLELGRQSLEVNLLRDRGTRIVARQTSPVEAGQALILGFPALRGAPSPDPGGQRPMTGRAPEPADLVPMVLAQVDPRMADFKQWIVNILSQSAQGSAKALSIRSLLDKIVAELVPGDFTGFADLDETASLRLSSPTDGGRNVPFSSVSHGMSSIFNWIGVLTQRLFDVYDLEAQPQLAPAIVLIDEIDVHLHPDWQRRLVALTKKFFPNVQIVATTHSPLIASSLHAEEVRVVEKTPTGQAIIRMPSRETYGRSADEIMQSELVGLRNARPVEVEEKISEYLDLHNTLSRDDTGDRRFVELGRELSKMGWAGAETSSRVSPAELTNDELANFRNAYKD